MPEEITKTPVQNSIYSFMKDNELTSKPEADFNAEYSDPNKAKELYGFFTENELTDKDFDSFYKDNFSSVQPQQTEQPLTYMQKELRQKGLIQDKQPKEEQSFVGKLGSTVGNSFMTGINNLNSWVADAPGFVYDLAGAPFRAVGLNVPTSQDFKDTPLEGISNFYKENAKSYEQKVQQANPARGNGVIQSFQNGDIEGGILNLAGGIAESAPASIAMMLSGGATAPTILGGAAVFGAGKAQEMDENAPEMDYDKRRVIAALNGTLEGIFETYLGSGAVGKSLAGIIKNEGKDVAKDQVKRSLSTSFADMITKNPWLAPLGEGFEEVGTQISQNFVDKYSGYKPELSLTEGVGDAFLSGVGMGGIHGSVIGLAKKAMEDNQQAQLETPGQLPDSTPQLTVNPRDTKAAELRQQAEQFASKTSGNIQTVEIITMEGTENIPGFVTGSFQQTDPDGKVKTFYNIREVNNPNITHNTTSESVIEVGEQSIDDFVNAQMGIYDQTTQQQELLKKNQVLINGAPYILTGDQTNEGYVAINPEDGSDIVIPANTVDNIRNSGQENANVVTQNYGKTQVTGIKNEDGSLSVTDPATEEQANSLKEQVEQATGGKATVQAELIPNEDVTAPQQFQLSVIPSAQTSAITTPENINSEVPDQNNLQSVTSSPSGDNELTQNEQNSPGPQERKIITQSFGNTPVDIIENEGYDEVVPTDKVPLEKALPALEKKFKDNKKFKLDVEKVQVEIPGETKYDDPTFKTVIKSIKIVPLPSEEQVKAENNKKIDQANLIHNRLVNAITDFNSLSDAARRKTNTGDIARMASELDYVIRTDNSGKLIVTEKGKPIGLRGRQKSQDEINSHNSIVDYDPEVQETASYFMNPMSIQDIDLGGLQPLQIKQAILDIQAGKKTVISNDLLDAIENIHKSGIVQFKPNRKTGFPGAEIPLDDYKALMDEEDPMANNMTEEQADFILAMDENDLLDSNTLIQLFYDTTGQKTTGITPIETSNNEVKVSEKNDIEPQNSEKVPETQTEKANNLLNTLFDNSESSQNNQLQNEESEKVDQPTAGVVPEERENTPQEKQGETVNEGLEENVNVSTDQPVVESLTADPVAEEKETRDQLENRLLEERKQRILTEGTGFDKEFGLIPPSDIKSADDIISNIDKILSTLKENQGNKKFDIFEGYVYGSSYAKNAGEQIRGYFHALDVLPNEIRKEFASKINATTVQELMDWASKKYKDIIPVAEQIAQQGMNLNPSEAQKEAGNYKKAHVTIQGMDIAIENPKGSFRSGVDEDGKAWENILQSHYGYFKRTIGKDNDHIDTFIGDNPESNMIFVVDQNNPKTGKFDESKVMTGFDSVEEAKSAYLANYQPDWKGFRSITAVPVDQFKEWLLDGAKQHKPFSEYKGHEELLKIEKDNARKAKQQAKQISPEEAKQRKINTVKALNIEPLTIEQLVLQYIAAGNRLNWDEIKREVFPRSDSEMKQRIWMLKKNGKTIDNLLGLLNGTQMEEEGSQSSVFRNSVIDAVLRNGTRTQMVNRILEIGDQNQKNESLSDYELGEALQAQEQEERNNELIAWDEFLTELENNGQLPTENELIELFLQDNSNDNGQEINQNGSPEPNRPINPEENAGNGQVISGSKPGNDGRASGKEKPKAELTPLEKEILNLNKERSELLTQKVKTAKNVNARNGLFGDIETKPGDLFEGQGFDASEAQRILKNIDDRISVIDQTISDLTQKVSDVKATAEKENAGQQKLVTPDVSNETDQVQDVAGQDSGQRLAVLEPWQMTADEFNSKRPSVEGYLYHGSPEGDIKQIDPYAHTKNWGEGLGFYTTESRNIADTYAKGRTATKDRKNGNGKINYVRPKNAKMLDMDMPVDTEVWDKIKDKLELDYIEEPNTNGEAYRELILSFNENNFTSEGQYAIEEELSNLGYDATIHTEGKKSGNPHRVTIWKNEFNLPEIVLPKDVHKEIVQKAIAEGKPVPQEVLNDYPELKKEQALPRDVTGSKSQTTILIPKGSRVVDKRNPKAEIFFESVEGNNVVVATIFSDRGKKRQGEIDIHLDEFLENFIEVTESGYKKIKSQVNQYEKAQPIRLGGLTEKEQLQKERDLLNIAESNKKEAVKSPLLKVLEEGKKAVEEKKPIQVKLFKHGEGGTKGLFEDSKGNLYKSLIQTWTSFKDGEFIKNEATKDSPEYEILKALQGNPNIPVIGDRVKTSEGAAFEIERLEDIDKLTLAEFFEIEKILDNINGQGFFVNDIVTVMRRPKTGELVIVDFSGGLNDKALIGNSSYSDNGFTSRLFEMLSEEDKAEGRRIRKEKHEQLLEKYFGKKNKKTEFKYNLRSRPFSIGTYPPNNFVRFEEDGTQFGSVIYSKEVPLAEVKRFELIPSAEGLDGDYEFIFSDKKFPAKVEIAKHQKGFDIIKTTINGKEEKMSVVEFMEQVNSGRFVKVKKQSIPLLEIQPIKPILQLLEEKHAKVNNPESAYSEGDNVSFTFVDGSDHTGVIQSIEGGKIKIKADGKNYTVRESQIIGKKVQEKKQSTPLPEEKQAENKVDPIDVILGHTYKSPESFNEKSFDEFNLALAKGKVGLSEFKKAFEVLLSSKDAIISELNGMTKAELLKGMSGMGQYRYKNEKKDATVKAIWSDHLMDFAFGSISYSFDGTSMDQIVAKKVANTTQKNIDDFVAETQKRKEEYLARVQEFKKALTNPETLPEFRIFIDKNGLDKLSPEQKAAYDNLVTDKTIERRNEAIENKAIVGKVDLAGVEMGITETKHTKTGADLFVVKLSERVSKEDYQDLNSKAKQLGGYYSSFRGQGAVPGFQFKTREQAQKFVDLKKEDANNLDLIEEKQDTKLQDRVSKLRENAQKIIDRVDTELSKDRLTNTAKRASQAASTEARLGKEKQIAQTMMNIADAIENGDVKLLDGIKAKTHIELLDGLINQAKYKEIKAKYPNEGYEQRKSHDGEPATVETVEYAKDTFLPNIYAYHIKSLVAKVGNKPGVKLIAARWDKKLSTKREQEYYQTSGQREIDELTDMVNALTGNDKDHSPVASDLANYNRLKSMGIENDSMLRAALREYVQYRGKSQEVDKVKKLERALVGRKNIGIDFFPTPKETAQLMVDEAGITEGMDVLEPSAGNGNIADAIKETGVQPDVIELSSALSEVLEAKGYDVVASDFMEFNDKTYDRIVMNPPFSNGMDGDHVMHAYDLLNPRGKLVAIVGEGTFIRNDKKAVAFREWLDSVGGTEEKLNQGTFQDKTLLNTTGANARLVIIEKPETDINFRIIGETGAANLDKAEEATTRLDNLAIAREMESGRRGRKVLFVDEHGKNIVYDDGNYRIAVDDVDDARYITLWHNEYVKGKEYWAKRGVLDAWISKFNDFHDKNGKYLSIRSIEIEKPYRGYGLGTKMYQALIDFSSPEVKGLVSYLPNRINKKQVPSIYRRLNGKIIGDYHFVDLQPKDAKTIKLATGWEKGVDGKWRYEVPDGKMVSGRVGNHKLSDIYEDDVLFNAYPELKDLTVVLARNNGRSVRGSFANNTIKIYADDLKQANSTLNHEIQHAIQEIEGFAKGGSQSMFKGERSAYIDRLQAAKNALYIIKSENKEQAKQELEALGLTNENISNLTDDYIRIYPELTIKSIIQTEEGILNPFNSYKRLAGEVESRNVQTRMNMTLEERRNTLLQETEDVAREDQIVLMDGLGVSNSENENVKSSIDYLQSNDPLNKQVHYKSKKDIVTYLEENPDKFSQNTINNVKRTDFHAIQIDDEMFINSDVSRSNEEVVTDWVHERFHVQLFENIPNTKRLNEILDSLYERLGESEIRRIVPRPYWNNTHSSQANEYLAHAAQELAVSGKLDKSIPTEIQYIITNIVNQFTTIKTIQDAKDNRVDLSDRKESRRDENASSGNGREVRPNTSPDGRKGNNTNASLRPLEGKGIDRSVPILDVLAEGKKTVQARKTDVSLGEKSKDTKLIYPSENYDLTEDEAWKFEYDLAQSLGLRGTKDYHVVNGDTILRIKGHTPNWSNFTEDLEDNPNIKRVINVTVGDYNNSDFRRNKTSLDEIEKEYPNIEFTDIQVEDGESIFDNIDYLSKIVNKPSQDVNTILINGVLRSTLNSNGKPIANSEEGIRNFYRWFQNSKVVDAEGRPLVVYHGTNNDFSEFKTKTGRYFFTDNQNVAKRYRDDFVFKEDKSVGIKANEYDQFKDDVVENSIPIIEAYLKIENPKVKDYEGENWLNSPIEVDIDKSKDGLIAKNIIDGNGISATTFIAFNPSQIKSATGNNGSFSPDDNNINFRVDDRNEPLDSFLANAAEQYQEKKRTRRNLAEVKEKVREFIQDHDLPIRRLEELVKKGGGVIKDNMKPYRDMSNSYGRNETLYKNFSNDKMKPIIKTISKIIKSGVSGIEVLPYMISKHAIERNSFMREKEFSEWEENAKAELQKWTDVNVDIPQKTKDRKVKEFNDESQAKRSELQKKDYSGVKGFDPENKFENPDELAQNIVDEFESKVESGLIDELWANTKEASSDIVNFWKAGQTMSAEQAEITKDRFKYFIPLRGWREGAAKQLAYRKGEGFSNSLQRAKGRTSFAENPLAYLQQTAFKAIGEQVDNEVKTSLLNLVTGNYDSQFQKYYKLKKAYYVKVNLPDGTFEWEMTMERPSEEMFASGDAKTKIYDQYQKLRTPSQAHEHEIYIKRPNGDMIVVMSDEMLPVAQAMNHKNTMYRNVFNGNINDAEFWNKPLSATFGRLNNSLKAMYTAWNVVFPLTNFARDIQEASITQFIKGDSGHMVLANYKNAFPAIIRDLRGKTPTGKYGMMLQEFRSVGGNTGFTHLKTPEQLEKEIKADLNIINRKGTFRGYTLDQLIKVKSGIEAWNQVFEDATRFSVYITSRENGKSMGDSAADSKEASVNFNRKGKSSKAFDSIWAFWNVAIQSMQKNMKLAKDHPGRFGIVAGSWLALGFLEAMFNDWAGGDDDKDYFNISEYVRENYLILPNLPALISGEKSDKYLRIPLPQFWRGFKSAGSLAYDVMNGKMDVLSATGKGLSNFMGGMLPIDMGGFVQDGEFSFAPLVPTIYKPLYEVSSNRDYMGFKIAKEPFTKEQEARLADSGLGKDNVSPAIKFCTDWLFRAGGGDSENKYYTKDGFIKKVPGFLDINPSVIEYIFEGYSGGTGQFLNNTFKTGMQAINPDTEVDFKNAPFLNSFFKKIPEAKWKIIGEYYDLKSDGNESKFDAVKSSYMKKDDKTKFIELATSGYYNEFNATLDAYDEQLTQKMKFMDYKTAEGSEDVINTMKDAIKAIKEVKQKYNRK